VVMRMRRQTGIGEDDAPAIKEHAAGHDSNEHSRVTLLGDDAGRYSRCSSSRPGLSPTGSRTEVSLASLYVARRKNDPLNHTK